MLARLTQMLASSGSLQGQATAELDDVVGDNGNADPALHPFEPSIPAAIQSVAPLQHANALIGVSNVACGPDWQQSARRLVDILITGSRTVKIKRTPI
jgi:hypothetical protein